MEIPTYLLFVLGCLGATDIALFHSLAHGIRSHPDSVTELVAHSLRGPVYATLFVFIPNFILQGVFIWGVLALFLIDVAISIWDFALEQHSRRFLGGLPSGEYVLHMLMAIVFGALVASFLFGARHCFSAPTRLVYAPVAVPIALRFALFVMAALVLVSGIQDAIAAVRLRALGALKDEPPQAERTQPLQIGRPALERRKQLAKVAEGQPPGWMRFVLAAAGIYNVLWGAWAVLFPQALFRWAGAAAPNYLPIWQCVGMLVGVYGIGYLICAGDPFHYWPIVLVGLLGKVLGPAGMCWSIAVGQFPAALIWICLTNDLIWWVPFALILRCVLLQQRQSQGQTDGIPTKT